MKITVHLTRVFDTDDWAAEDPYYPAHVDPAIEEQHAVNLFAEEIDYLVRMDAVGSAAVSAVCSVASTESVALSQPVSAHMLAVAITIILIRRFAIELPF